MKNFQVFYMISKMFQANHQNRWLNHQSQTNHQNRWLNHQSH